MCISASRVTVTTGGPHSSMSPTGSGVVTNAGLVNTLVTDVGGNTVVLSSV